MASMASIDGRISDAEFNLSRRGFQTNLWAPEFGWDVEEAEASATPFKLQMIAALGIFSWMFCADHKRIWVHLAAEMQAGKTGVVNCLIRLFLANAATLHIKPADIFILTGMKDNSWRLQTRRRVPKAISNGVQHNDGLEKVAIALRLKNERQPLCNVLIILDESHLADSFTNRPAKLIFDELLRMCPLDQWAERNIRVLTISATDPAKILSIGAQAQLVRLDTDENYQSVEKLQTANRIHETEDLITPEAVARFKTFIDRTYGTEPLYHIIRPRQRKQALTLGLLERAFPGCIIVPWDAELRPVVETGTVTSMVDINERLAEAPERITFIVLKNMFYASKTLDDTHVGVLHDRVSAKDDTNLQSLLGRACGYGKSRRTHIFTSGQTVRNYLTTWRDLATAAAQQTAAELRNRMPSVNVAAQGAAAVLTVAPGASNPLVSTGQAAAAFADRPRRAVADESQFESEWSPFFPTLAQAMAWIRSKGGKPRTPTMENGVYLCSTTGKRIKQPLNAIVAMQNGLKTANMPSTKLELNQQVCRLYTGYAQMEDLGSVRFVGRRLKRIAV